MRFFTLIAALALAAPAWAQTTSCGYSLSATNTTSLIVPSSGGSISFSGFIDNTGNASSASVDIWAAGRQDATGKTRAEEIGSFSIPANVQRSGSYTQEVVPQLADGQYTYAIVVGQFNESDPEASVVCDIEEFTVIKGTTTSTKSSDTRFPADAFTTVDVRGFTANAAGGISCGYSLSATNTTSLNVPSSGGSVSFSGSIDNTGNPSSEAIDIWAAGRQNSTGKTRAIPIGSFNIPANVERFGSYTQEVVGQLPDGDYDYAILAGEFNESNPEASVLCDMVEFTITKGAVVIKGNTEAATASSSHFPADAFTVVDVRGFTADVIAAEGEEVRVGPNPMRTEAAFAFALEADAPVRLAVYDVRGREVAVVVDGALQAGPHTASLRDDLPAGVYVWRLTAGERVQTGRLTVVR